MEVREDLKIFSCTCALAGLLGLGATLKDLPSYLHRHLMLRCRVLGYQEGDHHLWPVCRGVAGLGDHTIRGGGYRAADRDHIYIYLNIIHK